MTDALSEYDQDLLDGTHDCVDRIVLNVYHTLCYSPGGFRLWWRRLKEGAEEQLDNAYLMRLAGRFSQRVHACADAHGVPIVDCRRGEVSRAVAPVWEVEQSPAGPIRNLAVKTAYVQHYSFSILDPEWGHLTIKMSGQPPFGAQVILNGHEYVACHARKAGLAFTKEGTCFTHVEDAAALATIADTLSQSEMIGRLTQVCERWIYSACLCFGLSLEEQDRSGFRYHYSIYQVEYSRNLLFQVGGQMEQVFQGLLDHTRARLSVRDLKAIFGAKCRPFRHKAAPAPPMAVVIETPAYDLTLSKLHFGKLTLKGYTKGEHVLRFEAIVHNTADLHCGRVIERFLHIVARLQTMVEGFLSVLHAADHAVVAADTLEQLSPPSQVGKTKVGGLNLTKPRMRAVLAAVLARAPAPQGVSAGQLLRRETCGRLSSIGPRHSWALSPPLCIRSSLQITSPLVRAKLR